MFYIESVAGLPKEKLSRVWTHTLSIFGLLAAVVTIISFLGFHPSSQPDKGKSIAVAEIAKPKPVADENARADKTTDSSAGDFKAPKPNGIGTIHLEGGFSVGQAMLT